MESRSLIGPRWTVSQIGAREHYAVPRGLARIGLLERFYTDAWCPSRARWLGHGPAPLQRFAGRRSDDIPDEFVTAFNVWAGREALRPAAVTSERQYHRFTRVGQEFAQRVTRSLQRRPPQPGRDVFFGFSTGSLETLQWLRTQRVFTMVDQIDAAREHATIVRKEARTWPGWEPVPEEVPDSYFARLQAEWRAASLVVVNSRWSRDALVRQGVPADKIAVVPCGYDVSPSSPVRSRPRDGPLRLLWVGAATLAKGIAYLLEGARLLTGSRIQIRVVGSIGISRDAVVAAPPNVMFEGAVPHSQLAEIYRSADLFVFPTLSDGFGMGQLEAMSHGLPVIATPNCGEVVTHELDGLIVPPGDGPALAAAIARLDADRPLLAEMSQRALLTVARFSIDEVTRELLSHVAAASASATELG